MASLSELPATAEAILAAFAAELKALGISVPGRQYVAPGVITVWDGEQLVVNLQHIPQGQPGAPYPGTYSPVATNLSAQFAVHLVREVPTIGIDGPLGQQTPTAEEIGDAGQQAMTDAAALMEAAIAIHQAHTLTEPGEGFAIDGVMTMGPEGGLASNRLLLTFSLG